MPLCLQYGGSEAHATFFQRERGNWEAATQSRDLMTTLRRFYSNTYTDAEKQDAMNLFLGHFIPRPGHANIWDLDSDYYLHSGWPVTGESADHNPPASISPSFSLRWIRTRDTTYPRWPVTGEKAGHD